MSFSPTRTGLALAALLLLSPATSRAFEPFALTVPCRATATNSVGTVRPCITCHNNPDGGSGCDMPPCFNPFGMAYNGGGRMWNPTLAMGDADGDGYTNGEELGDPMGMWVFGMPTPDSCGCATRPGFPAFTPGDTDMDDDGYCCRGQDMNADGDCLDEGEHNGQFDCDDTNEATHSGATEICTNSLDNDCDGLPTLLDSDCADVVDRDGDGYCPMGIDNNRDRDCNDTGEVTADVDCDDDEVTVSPASTEFCVDSLDNDCNDLIDTLDPACTTDVDADSDGYCPIGRDLDGSGDCNQTTIEGVVEATAGFDCDDSRDTVNPDAMELCTDGRDNDCDGLADFRDSVDCGAFFDADGDGYCPGGRDGNGNGSCTDAGETDVAEEPFDCNDADAAISPGMMEVCTNGDVDDDCDRAASLDDPDCAGWIDTDADSFCFVGVDMDGDGTCVDDGEATGDGDCDETNAAIHPAAEESCTDAVDNDCDGSTDAADRGDCDDFRDADQDGFCLVGSDMNSDGDCSDAGEQGGPSEWTGEMDPHSETGTENNPIRYPGAPENCLNDIDDDLDGMIDEAAVCTRDTDVDGDGWCPIGRDVNMDGDCLDASENVAETDCNDGDAEVNPGQPERCFDLVDADCDGEFGVSDITCFVYLDRDGDGICETGIDDNGDGDCLDEDERRFGVDCDDRDPMVSSRSREVCDDTLDNDCDGDIDIADSQCDCEMDVDCDDGDPCTADTCGTDGECVHGPAPVCMDAGVSPDGGVGPMDEGCGCRAVGTGEGRAPVALLFLGVLGLVAARRRARRR